MWLKCLILTLAITFACAQGPSSFKLFIQQRGIEEIQSIVNPLMIKSLDNVSVPDVHWSSVGIHLDLTNITLRNFTFSTESISYSPPYWMTVQMAALQCQALMNWRYTDGPAIDWSGDAEDDISSTSVGVNIEMGTDGKGHAYLKVNSIAVNIGTLNIHLHGSGGKFFQDIVNVMTPLIKDIASKAISTNVANAINQGAQKMFDLIPINVPLVDGVDMYYGLFETDNVRGMSGLHYGNNHFSGGGSPTIVTNFDIGVGAYDSIDVSGLFQPPVSGQYHFQVHYKQRYQLDALNQTIGKLEMHNPGMCWPEWHTDSTHTVALDASVFYPIRLRYQSGCGGGEVQLSVCQDSSACQLVSPLSMTKLPSTEFGVTIWPSHIELAAAIEAYDAAHKQEAPFVHHPLPDFTQSNAMLAFVLDAFAINSIGYAFQQVGALQLLVNDSMLPDTSPVRLNTSSFEMFLPGLYAAYPNDMMTVLVSTYDLVELQVQPSGVSVAAPLLLNISVIDQLHGNAIVPVITLQMAVAATGEASVSGSSLTGQITDFSATVQLVWASVPVGNITVVQSLLNFFVKTLVLPRVNTRLAQGFPLPSIAGASLVNPKVSYGAGYIQVDTDFAFSSSSDIDSANTQFVSDPKSDGSLPPSTWVPIHVY